MQIPVISRKGQTKPYGSIPRINWDHPLAAELQFYHYDIGGAAVDLVSGNSPIWADYHGGSTFSAGTPFPVVSTRYGSAYKSDGSTNALVYKANTNLALRTPAPRSVAAGILLNAATTEGGCAYFSQNENPGGTAQPFLNWGLTDNSSGKPGFPFNSNGSYINLTAASAFSIGTYQFSAGVAAGPGQSLTAYLNGAFSASLGSATFTWSNSGNVDLVLFTDNGATGTNGFKGSIFWAGFWNRALSAAEVKQLYDDPYCFLIYPEDEIFAALVGTVAGASVGAAAGVGTATAIGVGIVSDPGQVEMIPQLRASRGPMQRMLSLLNFDLPSTSVVTAGDGGAAGIGTAAAVGTAVMASVGAASGVGEATGVGAATTAAVGSGAGAGTAAATGAATTAAVGSGAGAGTAAATGASTAVAVGAGSGTGSAAAVGTGIAPAVGAGSGTGAAAGTGLAASGAVGAASGTGAAAATGRATTNAVGAGSGIGNATGLADSGVALGAASGTGRASGVGVALFLGVGSASGTGAAAAVGIGAANAVGAGAGTGTANAVGQPLFNAAGAASGTGAAAALGQSTAAAVGSGAGTGNATAVGALGAAGSVGSAAGAGTAAAISRVTVAAIGSAAGNGAAAGVSSVVFAGIPGTLNAVERADRARFVVAQPPATPGDLQYGWPDVIVRRRL